MTSSVINQRASRILFFCLACACVAPVQAGLLDKLKKSLDEVKQTVDQTNQTVNEAAQIADGAANLKSSATELVPSTSPPANASPKPSLKPSATPQATHQAAPQVAPVVMQSKPTPAGPLDQNRLSILTGADQYRLRAQYFHSLGFDAGEYKVVKDPSGTFVDLFVPTYKGLPRLGVVPVLVDSKLPMGDYEGQALRRAFEERLNNDMIYHLGLCHLKLNQDEFTASNILIDRSGKPEYQRRSPSDLYYVDGMAPRIETQKLIAALFSPAKTSAYFCPEGKPCSSTNSLLYRRSGNSMEPDVNHSWGGGKDEFASRTAFRSFLDQDLPKLKAFAAQQSCDYYIVGMTHVGTYDFAKQGFSIRVPLSMRLAMRYKSRSTDKNYDSNGVMESEAFLPMPASQAEALLEKLKARAEPASRAQKVYPVFTVVKAQVYGHQGASSGALFYVHDIVSSTAEVFWDDKLTEKIFDMQLTATPATRN